MALAKTGKADSEKNDPFQWRKADDLDREEESLVHVYGKNIVCNTDKRGKSMPRGRSPLEIVVDASEGFIPLWEKDTTLRWRFQERAMRSFTNPESAKNAIRKLFGEALLAWGDAVPIRFAERDNLWDFEIAPKRSDDCSPNGCVLASAFFPDGGQHRLLIYPKMFSQSRKEQVETFIHEIGHIFGLRHFFAQISEERWKSEIFGKHEPFSIMNYGQESALTDADKADLKRLYQLAWSNQLTEINGTPIRLVKSYSATRNPL